MPKLFTFVLCFVGLVSICHGDRSQLDGGRATRVAGVLESLKTGNAKALAASLPALSEKRASALLAQISKSWGDLSKLRVIDQAVPKALDKGEMEIVVQWGAGATDSGSWLELESPAVAGYLLRIGLMFPKKSVAAKQFLAVQFPQAEQAGARQATTALDSKSEGKEKPKPETQGGCH